MEALENFKNMVDPNPVLSHKFGVTFLDGTYLSKLDFRFQKVGGLSKEVQLETINEGGQNLYSHSLPNKISHSNLVLERGYSFIPSALTSKFITTFSDFKFTPSSVLVTLFEEIKGITIPVTAWHYYDAYPVKWSFSDLEAQSNAVFIETMEFAYTHMKIMNPESFLR